MTKLEFIAANLKHRPLRTALVVSSFALTAAMFVSALTLLAKTRFEETGFSGPRLVVKPYQESPLKLAQVERVKQLPGVTDVQYVRTRVSPTYGEAMVWGASETFAFTQPKSLLNAPDDVIAAWQRDRQGVLTSKAMADQRNWKIGDAVSIEMGEGPTLTGTFVGYINSPMNMILMHYEHIMRDEHDGTIARFSVGCVSEERCTQLEREIDELFENTDEATYAMSQKLFHRVFTATGSTIPDLFTLIAVAVIGMTIIMTSSTLSINLRERASELATMRAIGFPRGTVFTLLVAESMLAGFFGGLIGALLPLIATLIYPVSFSDVIPYLSNMIVPIPIALTGVVVSTLLGALVCVLPAVRSMRKSVLEGLMD